jgi:hypothetical protein
MDLALKLMLSGFSGPFIEDVEVTSFIRISPTETVNNSIFFLRLDVEREHNLKIGDFDIIELNRLVVNEGLQKNVLSFFVSKCLKHLPKPLIVLSYADPNKGHHGYIYQATNWLYFGQGQRKDGGWDSGVTSFIRGDKEYHAKTVSTLIGSASKRIAEENGFTRIFSKPKHKYIFLLGTKKEKEQMLKSIPYKVMPYPKGDNVRYDSSYNPSTQGILF